MNPNEQLITRFYTCFQNKDYKGMQDCYADHATFNDPVFTNLNSNQVKAMWEMLLKSGKDLRLEFKDVQADDKTGSAEWIAYYTFSRTGNKVINRIKARFVFENGKIVTHNDHFDFYTWAKQSLGITGLLLGWTPFLKNNIQQTAMQNLDTFMKSNQ
jgi:ketosteroid isomerase-like protein